MTKSTFINHYDSMLRSWQYWYGLIFILNIFIVVFSPFLIITIFDKLVLFKLMSLLTEYLLARCKGLFEIFVILRIDGLYHISISKFSKDLLQFLKCEQLGSGLNNVSKHIPMFKAIFLVLKLSGKFLKLFLLLALFLFPSFDFNEAYFPQIL